MRTLKQLLALAAPASPFVCEMRRIHAEQLAATTGEAREAADAEMAHVLRMHAAGRFDEYLASRQPSVALEPESEPSAAVEATTDPADLLA